MINTRFRGSLLQSRARQQAVRNLWRLAVFSALAVPIAPAASRGNLDGFDDFMAKAMTEFKVPGAAVAVVKDGKIVFARGYGFFRGSPPRKLIPRHGTRFDIQDSTGITLEFKQDAAGKAQEVVVYTPDSAFVVPRKL